MSIHTYTISAFAKKAGVSPRMLRHYDEIGLLKPSAYSESGYRLYTDEDLAALQQIVALRYLNFPLTQIQTILQQKNSQTIQESLRRQKLEFEREEEHLRQVIQALDNLEHSNFSWGHLSDLIRLINSQEAVQELLDDSYRHDHCASLHTQYSTNPDDWFRFLFRQMSIKPGNRILEIDANDAHLWVDNAADFPPCELTQTSLSEPLIGRIQQVMEEGTWHPDCQFHYELLSPGPISLPENHYDIIVANHLFVHSTDLPHVLSTCERALKPGGRLYCVAIGQRHMKELLDLAISYDPTIHFYNMDTLQTFSVANGAAMLEPYFTNIQWHPYQDSIVTTDANELFHYLWHTYSNIKEVLAHKKDDFLRYIQKTINQNGPFHIQKEQGLFSASRRP